VIHALIYLDDIGIEMISKIQVDVDGSEHSR
jgi:hypothetical protein